MQETNAKLSDMHRSLRSMIGRLYRSHGLLMTAGLAGCPGEARPLLK